mgnify:CR=1 FL=1
MKEEAGMIRIAIGTLAVMMLAVPVCASVATDAPVRHVQATEDQQAFAISQDEVLALAKAQGLSKTSDIGFEAGVWSVEGASKSGIPMVVRISSTGEVLAHTS